MRRWFDAHLDLACLAENGRDMERGVEDCGGPWPPASVTLRSLREGGVGACLGTIFTEADGDDAVRYPAGDADAAHAAGQRQLAWYSRWREKGLIGGWMRGAGADETSTNETSGNGLSGSGANKADVNEASGDRLKGPALAILMECADPIRTPEELDWWVERGVVAIGLAWARGSRYASGNGEPSCSSGVGLTDLGRELVKRMDALGVVHDVSHLSDRALDELLSLARGRVVATHSNCRALLDGRSQRHLTDAAIREIAARGGVVGLNLFAPFLRTGLREDERPSIDDAVRHVAHIRDLVGHQRAVGLGSDLDGGFSTARLPAGIDRPRDFEKLAGGLLARGWSEEGVDAFAWGNWARFWGLAER